MMFAAEQLRMPAPILPRPFPQEHLDEMSDDDWRRIPVQWVPIHQLVPSQEGVALHRIADLLNGGEPEGGDVGRAVFHLGTLYLYDSHHRWLIAWLRGDTEYPVRIVEGGVR